ncbi:glycosyltransferase family protein [Butyrivibrio sp. MC2021]|uniref:glycosyltransferase family protein n=1 Tax=Butyrivibrio sp. MC2021 TaxID=1408306 RepID=UPI000A4D9C83|nr:glycosyltransferase [Butyrivibrio sp. MC2021]
MRKKGIDVGFINLNAQGTELADEYVREINKGFDAALAFNSSGQHETSMQEDNVFEYMHVPFFNWILDHPCEHIADIQSNMKNYHIICLDRDHVSYIKRYFPNIAGVHFLPLGGDLASDDIDYSKEAFRNRKYDISFTGSCFSLERLGSIIGNLPEELRVASVDMIEAMCDDRSLNNEQAFRYALQKNNIAFDDSLFLKYSKITAKTNPFVRSYIRSEVIQYLAASGVKMHLFGDGWDDLEDLGNIVLHGSVPYLEAVQCASDSRISFNIMPLFKDGLHDRIPTAMLNGSAVVTDGSKYINEIFISEGSEKELFLYDIGHPESIANVLINALEDMDSLYDVAQRGRKKAEQSLTWDSRIDELINILRG